MKPSSKLYQLIASEIARLIYCESAMTNQPHHADNAADAERRLKIILEPSFSGYDLRVTGRDRNQTKEYLADTYAFALDAEYYWYGHELRTAEKQEAVAV